MADKLKIGILASGKGSNIPSILQAIQSGRLNAEVSLLVSDKPNAEALSLAERFGISTLTFKPDLFNSKEEYDAKIAAEFWNKQISLIVLCGYTRVISLPLLKAYEKRIVNTHPSLLPAFGGKGMFGNKVHEAVIQRGVKITGCTVHLVDENIDEGPILAQQVVELGNFETSDSLKLKVLQAEEKLYPESIAEYLQNLSPINFTQLPYSIKEAVTVNSSSPTPSYFDDERKEYSFSKSGRNAVAICDVGLKRKENADTVLLTSDLRILGVADGVGSASEGKQTSRMIMSFIEKKWQNEGSMSNLKFLEHGSWLRKTVIEANHQILNWAKQAQNRVDIGSTLTVGLIDEENDQIFISNTGDSRAYLWRSETLYRLTRDHSEHFDPETGDGGALLFYMGGMQGSFGLDLFQLKLFKGDRLLICSDGLLYASENKIAQRFQENLSIKELSKTYLQDAYDVGAPDNTSIVIMDY
ncbi:MAG: phosphoribosylglycinamide formyltransferase [Candidatus Caenarcaniphilales bacterium]|nr:phosphoribosylglycinamide formyltransferase [Candidatus Caenarcaniphilales bacterium]